MLKTGVFRQYYAALSANIIALGYGLLCGWTSAAVLDLQSASSPLESGPVTVEEVSWIAAILQLGGICGNFIYGFLSDRLGRKMCLISLAFPQIASFLLIILAKNPTHLYISRFIGGFAGGGHGVLIPLYVTEISEDKIRGTLGSFMVLMCNAGILLAYIMGHFLDYETIPYVFLIFPLSFLVNAIFLPETPQYLMKRKREMEAEKSLKYFRNIRKLSLEKSEAFQAELVKLKNSQKESEKSFETDKLSWRDFVTPAARRGLLIGAVLMIVNMFSGCFAIVNYTANIFQEAGSSLSPTMSAIIVGAILFLGSYVATLLVERLGRKILLCVSCMGASFGFTALGAYTYLKDMRYDVSGFEWIPIASFSFVLFIASWGLLSLPFLVLSEVMPPKIRSPGISFCMALIWILAFIMVKFFPLLAETLKMHGSMFLFATVCLVGTLFFLLKVPETKGKSIEAIMILLEK